MTQAARIHSPQVEDIVGMDLSVGEILRRSRMHYNLSLSDIERELHIKPPQIEAIESDHFERLPGKVYAVGFIRSYSEFLGLDANKMVRLFKVQGARQAEDPVLNFPVCSSESKLPSAWVIATSVLAFIGVLIVMNFNMNTGTISRPIPEVPPRLQNLNSSDRLSITSAPAAPKQNIRVSSVAYGPYLPKETPSLMGKGIEVRVVQNSWVEIRDQLGKTLVSRVLKKGEKYLIPKKDGLTMTLGNAGGVHFKIDGKALRPIGKSGQVVRDLALDIEYLKKTFSQ